MNNSTISNLEILIEPCKSGLSKVADYLDETSFQLLRQIEPFKNNNIWTALSLHGFGPNASDIFQPGFVNTKVKVNTQLQWTSLSNEPVMKAVREIISKLPCDFERIRFTKLGACKSLKKYTDNIDDDIKNKKIARLHTPIRTNDDVIFTFYENENDSKGELFNLKTGRYYYLDVTKPHSVSNNSNIDRYHLIIDCFINDELKTLFNGTF
jgi:hypothetical protein